MLTQEKARQILSIPKVAVDRGKAIHSFTMDFSQSRDFRIWLSAADSIEKIPKYLLRIRVSEKLRTKISLHTQDNESRFCVLRLDFNGAPHKNPEETNANVPEKFIPFAGVVLSGNHVHYHVDGYPSAAWALPINEDPFPIKSLTEEDYSKELNNILNALADTIHLETKIILIDKMKFNGLD